MILNWYLLLKLPDKIDLFLSEDKIAYLPRLEIEEAFIKIGPIKNIWVARNPPAFAYVEMEDPRSLNKFVN